LKVAQGAEHDVAARLAALRGEVEACTRCPLHETRTQAVFGDGDSNARLMFVGEAPGYNEDKQGRPFVGAAGRLLEELLGTIGLTRRDVFIANVLKSRPPAHRDPRPEEIEACKPYLMRQIALIRPAVICSLGNFATKLLSGNQSGITKVHGVPQLREVEGHRFYLYPIFHPAAALYTPAMLDTLRADFFRLPQLLSSPPPDSPKSAEAGGPEDGGLEEPGPEAGGPERDAREAGDAQAPTTAPAEAGTVAAAGPGMPTVAGAAAPGGAALAPPGAEDQQLGLF